MKPKPENWNTLGYVRQMRHITGRETGVCWCNPALGENCDKCLNLADVKEEDRNYHEEVIILARGMGRESNKDDEYWMYKNFVELEDPDMFNFVIREYFIESGHDFDTGFAAYHKSLRQVDQYTHLRIDREKPDERGDTCVSSGILGSMHHSFLNISEIPYNLLKYLLSL